MRLLSAGDEDPPTSPRSQDASSADGNPNTKADGAAADGGSTGDGGGGGSDGPTGPCSPSATFTSVTKLGAISTNDDELGYWPLGGPIYFGRQPSGNNSSLYVLVDGGTTKLDVPNISDERYPAFTSDGKVLFVVDANGGVPHIYRATRSGPSDFAFVADNYAFGYPSTTPFVAGSELWFSADKGTSKFHVYVAALDSKGVVGAVSEPDGVAAGSVEDFSPVLSADGLRLYFASKRSGLGAQGDEDVWLVTRSSKTMPFGNALVVSGINSGQRDRPLWIADDECTMVIESNRAGSSDIWLAKR